MKFNCCAMLFSALCTLQATSQSYISPPNPSTNKCICPANYDPVCGSDGNTYGNDCEFKCHCKELQENGDKPIKKVSRGVCPKPPKNRCACPRNYDPVCGSDGKTYSNKCTLDCESFKREERKQSPITINSHGECPSTNDCICEDLYEPVCGNNNETYNNECDLECENQYRKPPVTIECNGTCPCDAGCFCTDDYDPVCGSDGKTYSNECTLDCESFKREERNESRITVDSHGECPSTNDCICEDLYEPVCGNNNETYNNECDLECENQYRKPPVTIECNGTCPCDAGCFCTDDYDPVCGSDGKTYSNECTLDCESFKREERNESRITVDSHGECSGSNDCICSDLYEPVCGNNNETYSNECDLECENQYRKPPVTIECNGTCPCDAGCFCTDDYDPVCGSDGKTYSNECTLDCESFKREERNESRITVDSHGECPDSNDCICLDLYEPVCGNNNVTYSNECDLECENRHRKPPVTIECNGICPCDAECFCTANYDPVCGSDGNTYGNGCKLKCHNKQLEANGDKPIKKVRRGECPKPPKNNCDIRLNKWKCKKNKLDPVKVHNKHDY